MTGGSEETLAVRFPNILLTGASGYIGGRLLPLLEARGARVRCLARRPEALRSRVGGATEVVAGDVLDPSSLEAALEGMSAAYYLVHSMGATGAFEEADRRAARNFGEAARQAGVRRIVYLGGLGDEREELSEHLRSRQEVGRLLGAAGVPVVEFRASIVLGSGSLSFELIRALVEKLPLMITPRWVAVIAQPIAVEDVLAYLVQALAISDSACRVYEIGGADRVSYGGLMRAYGRARGIRVRMLPVPFLTPYLSSLWLGLVTPLYARVGRKLIESIVHPTIVNDDAALRVFQVRPLGHEQALERALEEEQQAFGATRWSDALSSAGEPRSWAGVRFGPRLIDARSVYVPVGPACAFAPVLRIGGDTGWYAWNGLWRLRGFLDLLVGGVGLRRGRPSPDHLRVGDPLDFWRVGAFEPDRRLRLAAEMRLPGRAWLEFEVQPEGTGATIFQTAIFDPVGLGGRLYWYLLYPLHLLVFAGMLRGIARAATAGGSG